MLMKESLGIVLCLLLMSSGSFLGSGGRVVAECNVLLFLVSGWGFTARCCSTLPGSRKLRFNLALPLQSLPVMLLRSEQMPGSLEGGWGWERCLPGPAGPAKSQL